MQRPYEPARAADDVIRRRDEILQVMFWMRGERLGDVVAPDQLRPFLEPAQAASLEADLDGMVTAGLVQREPSGCYRLTPTGAREGGRRFAEEFEGFTKQGHGACDDPDCECHTLGPAACIN